MPIAKIDFDVIFEVARELGDVTEGSLHGVPSLKAGGRVLVCPALHKSAEPGSLAVSISIAEREQLIATKPDTYYVTDHYIGYPMVLVRMARLNRKSLRELLTKALQFSAERASKGARKPRAKTAARKK
jgi:hypothetical protein